MWVERQWDQKLLVWVETAFHEIDFTEAPEVAAYYAFSSSMSERVQTTEDCAQVWGDQRRPGD